MPIGVPRIIYCWGEELPAQWTDIYNFIFRRRMVFLMQYLDDELCNQICGLLINIHMEDRSKELEKKEMERSGVFKSSTKSTSTSSSRSTEGEEKSFAKRSEGMDGSTSFYNKKSRSMEDLLNADEDLGIDDIDTLEQFTLQKITTEWLNWNAQFFDYSDEPYLFYLAELLSKDFPASRVERGKSQNSISTYSSPSMTGSLQSPFPLREGNHQTPSVREAVTNEENMYSDISQLLNMLKSKSNKNNGASTSFINKANMQMGEVYSPFRTNTNFSRTNFNNLLNGLTSPFSQSKEVDKHEGETSEAKSLQSLSLAMNPHEKEDGHTKGVVISTENNKKQKLLKMFQNYQNPSFGNSLKKVAKKEKTIFNLLSNLAQKNFSYSSADKFNFGSSKNKAKGLDALHSANSFNGQGWPSSETGKSPSGKANLWPLTGKENIQEKILGQKNLRRSFSLENNFSSLEMGSFANNKSSFGKVANYLNSGSEQTGNSVGARESEFRDYYRKQTERALIEEESKKVFVIINSFGGSVGNGVTVHDALQFIKAGSLTLALGVAASAASLALAGGTIGERYVTEGCHVMIHQPESSLQGQASDIWIDSQEIMKIRLDVAEIYSLSTYRPRHKILRDLDRDFYLTATETIQYGLADEVATNSVMSQIIEMTSKVWDYHDSKQQRLLESRESASSGLDTQTQN